MADTDSPTRRRLIDFLDGAFGPLPLDVTEEVPTVELAPVPEPGPPTADELEAWVNALTPEQRSRITGGSDF